MRALPNDQWRKFCHAYVTFVKRTKTDRGRLVHSLRASDLAKDSTPAIQGKFAWQLVQDERMLAAIEEEAKKVFRGQYPEIQNILFGIARDHEHREQARVALALYDRYSPPTSRQNIEVTHRHIDPDQEGLEELRALRELGTSREKLIELFGGNGLARLERLEAADNARRAAEAKVIDGDFVEVRAHG